MYNFALKHELCKVNYAERIDVKIDTSVKIVRHPFTFAEIQAIQDEEMKSLVMIGCYTGMRINELITLKKEHIHEEDGILFIRHGSKTEAGRNRIIPMHPEIEPLIREKMKSENMFTHSGDKLSLPGAKTFFSKKLNKTSHDMRHTFATNWFGLNPVYGKLILGHAVRDITIDVYTHITPADLMQEMRKYRVK